MGSVTRYDLNEDVETGELFISPVPESIEGPYVTYEDYAALQQKLNAMAAENAALKDLQPTQQMITAAHRELEEYDNIQIDDDAVVFTWQAMRAQQKTPATDAYLNSVRAEVIKSVPTVCDGKEQVAFEDYARSKGLDLNQHPLHYLFLDDKTNTARNAWRECLNYVVAQVRSGTHDTADKAG